MNLLAVTVTLNIQTCIVRLYNVKKNTQHNMYSKKKIKKKHSGISGKFNISFFIIM